MVMSQTNWKWPEKDDVLSYNVRDIVMKIQPPELLNSRGVYQIPEITELRNKK